MGDKNSPLDPLNTPDTKVSSSEMIIGDIDEIINSEEEIPSSNEKNEKNPVKETSIIDINIENESNLYSIIAQNDYDYVTIEPRTNDVKLSFRKENIEKESRYISFPIYTNILLKVKATSKLIIEETQVAQEWKWTTEVEGKKYSVITKTVPSNLWEKLFIKLKLIDKDAGSKKQKKLSITRLFGLLWVLGLVALIIWGVFLSFIIMNAQTLEDVRFFESFGINLNDINYFIERTIHIIFSIVIFVQTIFLAIFLFKAILTKKIYKTKKIVYSIISFFLIVLTTSTGSAWLYLNKQVKNLPNWQEMSYWEVQIYDNSKLTNVDLFDKRSARILDTSNLIWPITLTYDISNWAKREQKQWFRITKYTWSFGWIPQDPQITPDMNYTFNQKGSYPVSVSVLWIDQKWDQIEKIINNVPGVSISHVVWVSQEVLRSGGKVVKFDAEVLREFGKVEWYYLGDWSVIKEKADHTWYDYQPPIIFDDTLIGMYIQRVWKESRSYDKVFIISKENDNTLGWEIIYNQDPINNLRYTFKVKDPTTGNNNGFVNKFNWKIWTQIFSPKVDIEDIENSSSLTHTFTSYGKHNIDVEIEDSTWKRRTLSTSITIDKKLELRNSLSIQTSEWKNLSNSYDKSRNEYLVKNLESDSTIIFNAKRVRSSNILYELESVSWETTWDENSDSVWPTLEYPIYVEWTYVIDVTYKFKHRKISWDTSILKERIILEVDTKQENLKLKVTPENTYVPTNVSFDASQSKIDGKNIEKFIYSYGDGVTEERDAINPSHRYTLPWTYNITLTVVTDDWEKYTTNKKLVLKAAPQKTKIVSSMKKAPIWQGIDFFSEESEWQIISYFWEFDDGIVSTEANPTHAYQIAGQYNVKLTLNFKNNNSLTDEMKITITDD